jgi:serine/threonine protein kinase
MSSDPTTRLNRALSGRYLIERELGEGGMATVYLAEDLRHERSVAAATNYDVATDRRFLMARPVDDPEAPKPGLTR